MASPTLSEDDIDDLLYFARTNDIAELRALLSSLAAQNTCSEAEILLAARDPDSGNTAAHYAAANGFDDLLKYFLTCSTTPAPGPILFATANAAGSTPLHYAAMTGALECAKVLVEAGADIKARNGMGHTPAYEAEVAGKQEVVGYLLKEGAIEEEEGEDAGALSEGEGQVDGAEDGVEGLEIKDGEGEERGEIQDG